MNVAKVAKSFKGFKFLFSLFFFFHENQGKRRRQRNSLVHTFCPNDRSDFENFRYVTGSVVQSYLCVVFFYVFWVVIV